MINTVWVKRSDEWIKQNPGKGTMYKVPSKELRDNDIKILTPKTKKDIIKQKGKQDIGIYAIICEVEKHAYIGQSINIMTRLRSHRAAILQNKGGVYVKMNEHYTKHGGKSFEFKRMLIVDSDKLSELSEHENRFMHEYIENGYTLYNINIGYNMYCPPELIDKVKAYINTLK